jgi:hypothetical protein
MSTFLTTLFLVPGFIHRAHLRHLEILIHPPYWDLPYMPATMSRAYDNVASDSIHQLEQMLQVENCREFRLKLIIVCTKPFQENDYKVANVKFARWMESALPLLLHFHEQGFILEIEHVQTSGSSSRSAGTRLLAANAIFKNEPRDNWMVKIRDLRVYVSLYQVFAMID